MSRRDPNAQPPLCHPAEARCACGSLLARWTEDGLELKCRRCKRQVRIPFPTASERAPPKLR